MSATGPDPHLLSRSLPNVSRRARPNGHRAERLQGCAGGEDPDLCITSDTTFMPGEDFEYRCRRRALEVEGGERRT